VTVIRSAQARRVETPNAVMTTLASPTQGGAGFSLWRVDMGAGQAGPEHVFDTEQIWTVLDGGATVELAGDCSRLVPGDTAVLPAVTPRRLTADPEAGFTAIVAAPAGARAALTDGTDKGVPPWIA